jgi:hypothetical protein
LSLIRAVPVIYAVEIKEDSEILHVMKFDPEQREGKFSVLQQLRFSEEKSELVAQPIEESGVSSVDGAKFASLLLSQNKTSAVVSVKRGKLVLVEMF